MPRPLDESERRFIAEAIRNGGKRNELARRVGRSPSVISKIAAAEGIEFDRSQTKKASEAKRSYAHDERLTLLNEGFDKARDILPDIQEPRQLQAWAVAVGTLIDKRRLEEGAATNREERIDPERRKRIKDTLNEIVALRRDERGPDTLNAQSSWVAPGRRD